MRSPLRNVHKGKVSSFLLNGFIQSIMPYGIIAHFVHIVDEATQFVCVDVLWPSQPSGVMSSAVSLPNHTLTGQT